LERPGTAEDYRSAGLARYDLSEEMGDADEAADVPVVLGRTLLAVAGRSLRDAEPSPVLPSLRLSAAQHKYQLGLRMEPSNCCITDETRRKTSGRATSPPEPPTALRDTVPDTPARPLKDRLVMMRGFVVGSSRSSSSMSPEEPEAGATETLEPSEERIAGPASRWICRRD
ncbi:hypothetical protein FOZ62_024298, partial [Perkinsus olseni]